MLDWGRGTGTVNFECTQWNGEKKQVVLHLRLDTWSFLETTEFTCQIHIFMVHIFMIQALEVVLAFF